MRSKELRAQRAKLIVDARALIDKDKPSAEETARFDEMMKQADELKAQIDRLERAEAQERELSEAIGPASGRRAGVTTGDVVARERRIALARVTGNWDALPPADHEHYENTSGRDKRILTAILRGRMDALSAEDQAHYQKRFQAAASEGTNSAGGYTVAPLFMRELLIAMKAYGGMRQVARTVETDTGAALPWPTMDDTANKATLLSENTQVSSGTDLSFGQQTINAYTWTTGVMQVSLQLLQDSAFDFDKEIRNAISTRFGRGQNDYFTTGTGSSQPQGVVTGAASGYTMPTGNTTSVTFDGLAELVHSVDPAYRPGARFMFHDSTLKAIRELKDSYGRYLWQPGVAGGTPDTIWDYPYTINQSMATMAANAKSVLFGNFDNYIIRDVLDMQMLVLRERYADYLQVGYIAFSRADGKLISAASPIKYLANSAT